MGDPVEGDTSAITLIFKDLTHSKQSLWKNIPPHPAGTDSLCHLHSCFHVGVGLFISREEESAQLLAKSVVSVNPGPSSTWALGDASFPISCVCAGIIL